MAINKPYYRTCRQFTDGSYSFSGKSEYIEHSEYAKSPEHYIRAFAILLKDMQELFDYIEPSDKNHSCYSYRIHELLLRACVEVEANCKAILTENGYIKRSLKTGKKLDLKMEDYRKINITHRLSSYEVKMPFWHGAQNIRKPFEAWATPKDGLLWYQAYNATKHDRHQSFDSATFERAIDAMCGLVVLLSSQFYTYDFGPGEDFLALSGNRDGMESAIGGYFRIKFPSDWPTDERYDFDWQQLKQQSQPFQKFDYSTI